MEKINPNPVPAPDLPFPDVNQPELITNLMSNLPGMAYRCLNDRQWTLLYVSPGCLKLTGYTEQELLGNDAPSFNELTQEEDRNYVRQSIEAALSEKRQFQLEYRIVHRDGSLRWVWEQGVGVYDDQGNTLYLDGFIANITNRKRMEQDIKKVASDMVELNATKDKFFALIAHDLQNPVYAIISLSEFLESNQERFTPQETKEFINQINVSAKSIYTLLENLLDWAKCQTGKISVQREHFSLPKLIEFLLEYFRPTTTEKQIELVCLSEAELVLESDSRLLTSVLRNLISNAIKYSYPGSKVQIKLSVKDEQAEIAVTDRGTGIPRRHLDRIFRIDNELKALGTNSEEGSGLGLILVKAFTDMLGGSVKAVSKVNQGSTFSVILPLRKPER